MPVRSDVDRAPQLVGWLTDARRFQMERDLADLPDLMDQLEENYNRLLSAGSRCPDDQWISYPIDPRPLDLADRRHKAWVKTAAFEAELARVDGSRRLGVLPTLEAWVRDFEATMLDLMVQHDDPILDDTGTITTATGWLSRHLDWIGGQQDVVLLAGELRDMVCDLEQLVGQAYAKPDDRTALCALDLAELLEVSSKTVYTWKYRGWIDYAIDKDGQVILDLKGRHTFWVTEARGLMKSTPSKEA